MGEDGFHGSCSCSQESQESQERDRRQGINVGAGGKLRNRGKDGFHQELRQYVAARAGDEAHKRAVADKLQPGLD